MGNSRKSRPSIDAPLRYGHRVEAWMRASYFGTRGVNQLLHALLLQQTPACKKHRKRVRLALNCFREAANWVRISQSLPPKCPRKLENGEESATEKS